MFVPIYTLCFVFIPFLFLNGSDSTVGPTSIKTTTSTQPPITKSTTQAIITQSATTAADVNKWTSIGINSSININNLLKTQGRNWMSLTFDLSSCYILCYSWLRFVFLIFLLLPGCSSLFITGSAAIIITVLVVIKWKKTKGEDFFPTA